MLNIYYTEKGALISGDEDVLAKANIGTGAIEPSALDISDISVNAQSLEVFYEKARCTGPILDDAGELVGYPHARRYVSLRNKFIKMIELAKEPSNRPTVKDSPGITSVNSKPINA